LAIDYLVHVEYRVVESVIYFVSFEQASQVVVVHFHVLHQRV